jgi:hypothetical protein
VPLQCCFNLQTNFSASVYAAPTWAVALQPDVTQQPVDIIQLDLKPVHLLLPPLLLLLLHHQS